jgi:hypothetical protein
VPCYVGASRVGDVCNDPLSTDNDREGRLLAEHSQPWWHDHWREEVVRCAYLFRVAEEPILALRALTDMTRVCEELTKECVRDCRAEGKSWTEIADALRVTRQAAQRRFTD